MTQTIHEIKNSFDAYAKGHGYCLVMFMIYNSNPLANPQFIIKVYNSGDIRTVDQNDLKVYGNPAAGEALIPDIPEDWKPKTK